MTQVITNNAPGQTVSVLMPDSGTQTAIVSSAGGILDLGFDPGTATTSRVDNNLVFEVDGGGTVSITDFFVVGTNVKSPSESLVPQIGSLGKHGAGVLTSVPC